VVESTGSGGRVRVVRVILALVVLVEALVAIGYGIYLGVETLVGNATQQGAAAVLALSAAAIGIALLPVARGALLGRRGVRAPIMVWQVLQASVGYPALATRTYLGVGLIACSAVALVAVFVPGVIDPADNGVR
jgi:hypothetical protein